MRILRFLHEGRPTYGVEQGEIVALANGTLFNLQPTGEQVAPPSADALLAPLIPTDILCIGLNYRAHAEETGGTVPENPMLFIKSGNALADPRDVVELPANSGKVDYEAELVIVMKKDARKVSEADALDYVFGYTCANDVSARDWQKDKHLNGGQFARGKSFDKFCPLGPAIVTADEIGDPNNLAICCRVSGETLQSSTTSDMIFSVQQIIASLSQTMTVRSGSVILTGTPEGVGAARTPPRFLRDGDVVEVEIERIGTLITRFATES